jgi:hypothetical protein
MQNFAFKWIFQNITEHYIREYETVNISSFAFNVMYVTRPGVPSLYPSQDQLPQLKLSKPNPILPGEVEVKVKLSLCLFNYESRRGDLRGSGGIALGIKWRWMVSFTRLLYPTTESTVPSEKEAAWALDPIWTLWSRETSLA